MVQMQSFHGRGRGLNILIDQYTVERSFSSVEQTLEAQTIDSGTLAGPGNGNSTVVCVPGL
jgi:hypothetical protein